MSRKPSAGQKWALAMLALAITMPTLGTALYVNGIPKGFWGGEPEEKGERYRHLSLSDAERACRGHAEQVFGERIQRLRVDRFSSRLDKPDGQFKVFMEAEIYTNNAREGVARNTFINCFTDTASPEVELFQYAKKDGQFIAPGEESEGVFGL